MRQAGVMDVRGFAAAWRDAAIAGMDVAAPRWCVGCGAAPGTWCATCASWADSHDGVRAWLTSQVPCAATLPYQGPVRHAVSAVKDRYRYDGIPVLGELLARAVADVAAAPAVLVPVPSRAAATRRRGRFVMGDIAVRAAAALGPGWAMAPILRFAGPVAEQSSLTRAQRRANVASRVAISRRRRVPAANYVVVDDVVTSGASVSECVRALTTATVSDGRPYTATVAVATVSWVC